MLQPMRYSSVTPDGHSPDVLLGAPGAPAVNFSGTPGPDGAPSKFTVGGRIRLTAPRPSGTKVMTCFGPAPVKGDLPITLFQIGVDPSGQIIAGFADATQVQSHVSLTDNEWHFIAVSFQGAAQGKADGVLRLFVDGVLLDEADGLAPSPAFHECIGTQLGWNNDDPIAFGSWVVWDKAVVDDFIDVPDWGEPDPDEGLSPGGLAAAANFSEGQLSKKTADGGWQTLPWSGEGEQDHRFRWNTPCLQIHDGSYVTTPPSNSFLSRPAGAPFTLMGWMGVQSAANGFATFVNSQDFAVRLLYDAAKNVLSVQCENKPGGPGQIAPILFTAADMQMIAATYDGSAFRIFVDGKKVIEGPVGSSYTLAADTMFAGNHGLDLAVLQNLMLFTTALSPHEMAKKLEDYDPEGDSDCQACVSLTVDLSETKSGQALVVANAGATNVGEFQMAVAAYAPGAKPLSRHVRARKAATADDMELMRYKDYIALARKHGIDPNAAPPDRVKRDVAYQQNIEWFDTFLDSANVDRNLRVRMQGQFARNLAIGVQLAEVAPSVGRFSIHDGEGGRTVRYRGVDEEKIVATLDLPFARGDMAGTGDLALYVKLFLDCVSLVLNALGAVVSLAGIKRLTDWLGRGSRLETLADTFKPLMSFNPAGASDIKVILSFAAASLKWVRFYYSLFDLVYTLIFASWWSFIWTVTCLVVQILAFVVSAGALLAIKIAQMAIAAYNITEDIIAIINAPSTPLAEAP